MRRRKADRLPEGNIQIRPGTAGPPGEGDSTRRDVISWFSKPLVWFQPGPDDRARKSQPKDATPTLLPKDEPPPRRTPHPVRPKESVAPAVPAMTGDHGAEPQGQLFKDHDEPHARAVDREPRPRNELRPGEAPSPNDRSGDRTVTPSTPAQPSAVPDPAAPHSGYPVLVPDPAAPFPGHDVNARPAAQTSVLTTSVPLVMNAGASVGSLVGVSVLVVNHYDVFHIVAALIGYVAAVAGAVGFELGARLPNNHARPLAAMILLGVGWTIFAVANGLPPNTSASVAGQPSGAPGKRGESKFKPNPKSLLPARIVDSKLVRPKPKAIAFYRDDLWFVGAHRFGYIALDQGLLPQNTWRLHGKADRIAADERTVVVTGPARAQIFKAADGSLVKAGKYTERHGGPPAVTRNYAFLGNWSHSKVNPVRLGGHEPFGFGKRDVPGHPIAATSARGLAYFLDTESVVTAFGAGDSKPAWQAELPGNGATAMAVGERLWVAEPGNRVLIPRDLHDGKPAGEPINGIPRDTRAIAVTNRGVWVARKYSLTLYSTRTRKRVGRSVPFDYAIVDLQARGHHLYVLDARGVVTELVER